MDENAAKKQPESLSIEREAPKERFIRTFATDSAAVQAGQAPGFTSQKNTQAPSAETLEDKRANAIANAATDTIDVDMKAPAPAALHEVPPAPETGSSAAERLVAASPIGNIPALTAEMMPIDGAQGRPLVQTPTQPVPAAATASPIHTYTSDFADEVAQKNATPASILAAEEDARPVKRATTGGGWNVVLILSAVLLLILGAGGTYFAYSSASKPTTVPAIALVPAPIFVDDRALVSGTGATLASAIEQSVQQPLASGAVRLIYTEGATASDNSVFSALQLPAPDILLRNIDAPSSMAGIVNVNGTQSPFFILAVESYSDTFAGMLQWEPTMESALASLYPAYSTGASTTPTINTQFIDEVVDNHNARVLEDSAGNTILIYGYWDEKTLVIARDEASFTTILGRLATSRTAE